jgi:hypothetical protein
MDGNRFVVRILEYRQPMKDRYRVTATKKGWIGSAGIVTLTWLVMVADLR